MKEVINYGTYQLYDKTFLRTPWRFLRFYPYRSVYRSVKKIKKNFKKGIDKLKNLCYNKDTIKKERGTKNV